MAEEHYHGKKSSAHWETNEISQFIEWSVSLTADVSDSSVSHATTWGKTKTTGYHGGTATVKCYASGDFALDSGAEGTLELLRTLANADGGYAGKAVCTGVSQSTENGTEVVTYSFIFNGAISNTVTEGTS